MTEHALKKYNDKRNFARTPEPAGKAPSGRSKGKRKALVFTVQKHDASHQHYDFRLEWDGVLLSWAVPKGPSCYPKDKRLAVRTEDHPLSYHDFEGIIPEKEYGAGPVMLWDTGVWTPLEKDPGKALAEGKITFLLEGRKLRGEWTLARMAARENNRENWLLIKRSDEHAVSRTDGKYLEKTDYSVKTGRRFSEIAGGDATGASSPEPVDRTGLATLERRYKAPQLATLVEKPPAGDDWIHEVKYDGYRVLVFCSNGRVRIRTRNGHDWTDRFPDLRQAFEALENETFVIDGEVVVINEKGLSDFKALQNALSESGTPMQGFFFDLLYRNGRDYSARPLSERRKVLEELFSRIGEGPLYLSEMVEGNAETIIGKACELDLEGIISKKRSAGYTQRRSRNWLKSRCHQRQEFVICGFIPATGRPDAVGALHLGFYRGKALVYAGKVGTGFDDRTASALYRKLNPLQVAIPPFSDRPTGRMGATVWVRPELLCEVKFAMWTDAGKVRHASYQGLRSDKAPRQIEKEVPVKTTRPAARRSARSGSATDTGETTISNADRQIFPDAKITKGDLAAFYYEMREHIFPGLAKRPISVVRCPGGIDRQCFFQRSKGPGMPAHINTVTITHGGKSHEYMYLDNITGLIELVQMGGIEIHPWGVRIDNTEKPDRLVFDLDPDENIPFEAVRLAAVDVRDRLADLGLESFLKCTGGKGLHVTAPVQRRQEWNTVKAFARNFAERMVEAAPSAYTTNMSMQKRKGKIFIDYLRNDFASTAVMDYCVRARPGASVAVPLDWRELDGLQSADQFSIQDVRDRKNGKRLFRYPDVRQGITRAMLDAVG